MPALRRLAAIAVVLGTAALVPPVEALAGPPERAVPRHLHDPRLEHEIEVARGRMARTHGRSAVPTVIAEVLTADTATVARLTRALGGEVQGTVEGALVQVRIPVTAVDSLASLDIVTDMQYPRTVGRIPEATPAAMPRPQATDTGAVGQQVAATNAAAWHTAGITGAGVRIGIIDYFDLSLWDTVEHGPLPDASRQFCQDSVGQGLCAIDGTIRSGLSNSTDAFVHGVAVAEVIHDMAPDAQLYIASVATTADLQAAINWFAARGVRIVNRSLGSAYDGPGDGTGPLAEVVNSAAAKGITWFNSAGNDGEDAYLVRNVASTVTTPEGSYVNFNDGRLGTAPDTWLRVTVQANSCFYMDGVRWSTDWRIPASQRTDYAVEFWEPRGSTSGGEHSNPTPLAVQPIFLGAQGGTGVGGNVIDRSQRNGASPLEAADIAVCPTQLQLDGNYAAFIRIRRNAATPVGARPDRLEVAIAGSGALESGLSDRRGSAAKPVVDSRNAALVSVGAVDFNAPYRLDGADPQSIAWYSSQGPTSDGRTKPDVASFSGMASQTYLLQSGRSTFSGTSSASPTAAGVAALVLQSGLAVPGAPLAAMVRHLTVDRLPRGDDNAYGSGITVLPAPPTIGVPATKGRYEPLAVPSRILDTRRATHIGPTTLIGPYRAQKILDLRVLGAGGVPTTGVTAVAVNVTSIGSRAPGYVQALPTLRSAVGTTRTLNVTTAGTTTSAFAIVPVGSGGRISLYLPVGGEVVVDVQGWFTTTGVDVGTGAVTAGRLVPLAVPEHWRTARVAGGSTTVLTPPLTTAVPADGSVRALVVVTSASSATSSGFVRLVPAAVAGAFRHTNVSYVAGQPATNVAIVPIGSGGLISAVVGAPGTSAVTLDVDVVGWITSSAAPSSATGTFVPLAPQRLLDTRPATAFAAGESRTVVASQGAVPADAIAVSVGITVTGVATGGRLQVRPGPPPSGTVRTVTYAAGQTVATGAITGTLVGPSAATVNVFMDRAGHAIIDANGYFVGPPSIT